MQIYTECQVSNYKAANANNLVSKREAKEVATNVLLLRKADALYAA